MMIFSEVLLLGGRRIKKS